MVGQGTPSSVVFDVGGEFAGIDTVFRVLPNQPGSCQRMCAMEFRHGVDRADSFGIMHAHRTSRHENGGN